MPESIGQLTALTMLSLSSNQLRGEVPMWLGHLVSLQTLYLNDNPDLGGSLPSLACEIFYESTKISGIKIKVKLLRHWWDYLFVAVHALMGYADFVTDVLGLMGLNVAFLVFNVYVDTLLQPDTPSRVLARLPFAAAAAAATTSFAMLSTGLAAAGQQHQHQHQSQQQQSAASGSTLRELILAYPEFSCLPDPRVLVLHPPPGFSVHRAPLRPLSALALDQGLGQQRTSGTCMLLPPATRSPSPLLSPSPSPSPFAACKTMWSSN